MDDNSQGDALSRRRALTRLGGLALGAYSVPAFTTLSVAHASGGSGGSGGSSGGSNGSDGSDASRSSNASDGSCASGSEASCGDQTDATQSGGEEKFARNDSGLPLRRWWRKVTNQ